jgi:hypothetical protein
MELSAADGNYLFMPPVQYSENRLGPETDAVKLLVTIEGRL